MEITEREKELICHLIQMLKLDSMCDALAEAYPTDKSNDTKAKVTEMADLMERLKGEGYGVPRNLNADDK